MQLSSIFQPQRFYSLFRRDVLANIRMLTIASAAVALGLFLIAVSWAFDNDPDASRFHAQAFPIVFFIGGILYTSIVFNELDNRVNRQFYLALPASRFEKLLSKWLLSAVFYIVFAVAAYSVFAWINNQLIRWWADFVIFEFNPFLKNTMEILAVYLVIQTIFFLGAITFTKFALPKTFLSLFVFNLLLFLICFGALRILFAEYFDGMKFTEPDLHFESGSQMMGFIEDYFQPLIKFCFWGLLGPLMLVIAYFKLTEKEV